jgi:hypothetical protein
MTADHLLETARGLCDGPPPGLEGRWPRAAALLTRQALEVAVDDYWAARAPGVGASRAWRPKLLCLDEYLPDRSVARNVHQTWGALSRACHLHPYELDPTSDELRTWIDAVTQLRDRLQSAT